MIPGLQPIPIKELQALSCPKVWLIEGYLEELPSHIPIKGTIIAEHQRTILSIKGDFQTVLMLCCDRCFRPYKQTLHYQSTEVIGLTQQSHPRKENKLDIPMDEPMEYLDTQGCFSPNQWLFEQLSLQMPLLKICGKDCPGPSDLNTKENFPKSAEQTNNPNRLDPRWAELKKLISP